MVMLDIILSISYYILKIYALCLVVAGILSFVGASPYNPIVTFFRAITAPPCRILTKRFPGLVLRTENGFIDISPVILILLLGCLMIAIEKLGFYFGISV